LRVLALERLKLVHLSRSSFLHSGASVCVWHHSATACSTSERVMPRGFGSISSITLPEGGGELRVGNSRQAVKPRGTASWLESRCPVMRSRVLTISEQACSGGKGCARACGPSATNARLKQRARMTPPVGFARRGRRPFFHRLCHRSY